MTRSAVMPGLVPGIHADPQRPVEGYYSSQTAWMAVTSTAMTAKASKKALHPIALVEPR